MPFNSIGSFACKALQANYVDYFKENSAEFKTGGDTSLIKFLLSPQNTRGFKKIEVESIPGKKRAVAFLVDNPYCFDVCNPAVTCLTTKEVLSNPSMEIVFDLNGNAFRVCDGDGNPMVLEFNSDDLMRYCTESDQSYIQRHIIRFLMRFEEALDKKLGELLLSFVGTNIAGEAVTELPFFVTNTATNSSVLNPDALWWLDQNYADIEGKGQYALLGGKIVAKIISFLKWSGLNSAGIDLTKIDDLNPYSYYSKNMNGVLGQDSFLQLSPGAAQLVTWNRYKGEKRRQVTDLYSNGTIVTPSTGLEIDWTWRYDYDCEVWKFEPSLHAELAVNKPGGCGYLATTNGIIRYQDCSNGIIPPVCP